MIKEELKRLQSLSLEEKITLTLCTAKCRLRH